jgi:anti-anti-sigma factor
MNIQTTHQGDIPILALSGRIDPATSPQLEEHLNAELAQSQYRAVLNLTGVEFISSNGLRVFLAVLKKAKILQGNLKLCGLSADVGKIFRISGFDTLFDISSTEAEAVQRFAR